MQYFTNCTVFSLVEDCRHVAACGGGGAGSYLLSWPLSGLSTLSSGQRPVEM